MSSFDKDADNLLQTLDREWNQNVKNDELVLAFTVGANCEQGTPPSLPQLLEVTPAPENTGGNSFPAAKPCSYLDCSGIKFGVSTSIDSTFTSVVILNRYLDKVKFAKVLIFIPYNKLTQGEPDANNSWSSTIFSCPAIHLLHELSQTLKLVSFGLIVIQTVESEQKGNNFEQLLTDQRNLILNNRSVEDLCPQRQLHLNLLQLIVNKDVEFLILPLQNYRWDGTVKSLVDLKSPPGYKIMKFHQQYLRVTNEISGKRFLSILKKVHDEQHFTSISSRLHNQLIYRIRQLIASTLSSVLEQYSFEATCLPQQQSYALELVERLSNAIEFSISSDSFEVFMELIILLDYPLDIQLHEKLLTYFMQLRSITEISNVLDIDIDQQKCQLNLKKECKIFSEKVKQEVFPTLTADLLKERKEIRVILQSAYQAISQSLIDFFHTKFFPENLSLEKSRDKAIKMLCEDEKLLEFVELIMLVEPETSVFLQVAAYENLCNSPGYKFTLTDFLEEIDHLKALENQYKSAERALQLVEHQNTSCGNRSVSNIFKKLRDRVNEVRCSMKTCSEVVKEIKKELDSYFNQFIVTFEEEQICTGLDMESLAENPNKINSLMGSLEERQNGDHFLTAGELITELECISELFLDRNLCSEHKAGIEKGLGKLETFLESIHQENMRADIYQDLFTTSVQTILLERLTGLEKLMTVLVDMKESLSSYSSQSNQQSFLDHASQIHCRLLNLLCENLPDGVGCIDMKLNTIKTNSPVTYLSLAKEIVKYLHPRNTKVELISDKVVQITGIFVKFSDFVCNEVAIHNSDLKEIHVFATQRIFVNEDFCDGLGRELEITLISPNIEIIGERVITLNGKPGTKPYWSLANTGLEFGQDGKNGLPGKAGGNGGHLYLVCERLINAALLTVDVQGGNGGDGQDGGNGCCGAPGRSAQAIDLSDQQTEKEGEPGSPGGNGGDGGIGGDPGHGGSVEVIVLKKQDGCVKTVSKDGERGNGGRGGVGGTGGRNGDGIQRVKGWTRFDTGDKRIVCHTRAPDGNPGEIGANSTNQVSPPPKKSRADSHATVISEVRKFYMNQSNNWSLSVTREFLEKFDLRLEFEHVSVKSLAEDLLNLELTSRNVHDSDSMIQEHEAFQHRLYRYVHLLLSEEQLEENEYINHVIKLLYAQSVRKVVVLKEYQEGHGAAAGAQVINLLGYFDIIKETIHRLKESDTEINRREALKTYHSHLKDKCEDTMKFISQIVLPSIAQAKKDIQEEMSCCAGEVEFYRRMVDEDLKCRYNAAAKIQFWDKIKVMFDVLEFGIGVAKWLNASQFAGKALLGAAGKTLSKPEEKKIAKKEIKQPNIQLPDCLNNFHGTMEDKMARMRKECELVQSFILDDVFAKITPHLKEWQGRLTQSQLLLNLMKGGKLGVGEKLEALIAGMEKNKTEILNFLHEMLEGKSTNDIELSSELIENIKHLLVDMALANCESPRPNFPTKKQLSSGPPLKIAQSQLQSVQKKYAAIFENSVPLINAIFATVQDNLGTSKNSSYASQKLEKLRIQTSLRKLKENLASFFNGLESKTGLIQAVQQMEEGLSVLIDLYDMMDNYEESKLFSEALAGIKPNSKCEEFADLQEIVDNIEYLLRANTFILDYNRAVHAFKQWIFPFANKCTIFSLNFETESTGDHLEKLAETIDGHFTHLRRYRSMNMDLDDVVFRGKFSSKFSACPPFYVWECEEWGNMINRLLRGEEVELRADLMKAEELIKRKMVAVKFKTIQLKIRPTTEIMSREEELNELMNDFRVTMVHSGISYYKVFDQCFVVRGSRNEYSYSFDGATKNSTYEKSGSQGDYLLSPFTIWKFRLNEILDGGGGFERLNKFEGQVDLELWGDGLYLDEGKAKEKKLDEKYLKDLHLHYELVKG